MRKDKDIVIIAGHYGSGKTEFAVNYAMDLALELSAEASEPWKEQKKIALADLDVVNVYFRSREKKKDLEAMGIKVISSNLKETSTLDLPAVSPEVATPLEDRSYYYIIDVGGDSVGARLLGRFQKQIRRDCYDLFIVINGNREQTATVEGAVHHIRSIEDISCLQATGLINNTHLVHDTTLADIQKGDTLVRSISEKTGIPVVYTAMMEKFRDSHIEVAGEKKYLRGVMRQAWM